MNLAGTTIAFGVVLIVLGVAGYPGSGGVSVTALIPAIFGVVLAALACSRATRRCASTRCTEPCS